MPEFRFFDYDSHEYFYETMSEEELEVFLAEHKNVVKTHHIPQIHTNTIGGNQHKKAFREVLNKIHNTTAGSKLNKTTEI